MQQPARAPKNPFITKPGNELKWQGPYLQKAVPLDPWARPNLYKGPVNNGDFELMSCGKDGQPGGEAENADLSFR